MNWESRTFPPPGNSHTAGLSVDAVCCRRWAFCGTVWRTSTRVSTLSSTTERQKSFETRSWRSADVEVVQPGLTSPGQHRPSSVTVATWVEHHSDVQWTTLDVIMSTSFDHILAILYSRRQPTCPTYLDEWFGWCCKQSHVWRVL